MWLNRDRILTTIFGTRSMNTHATSIDLTCPVYEAFKALVTPSSIRTWWGASRAIVVPGEGGIWAASWGEEDLPDFVNAFTISRYEEPGLLQLTQFRYLDKKNPTPEFTFNMNIRFELSTTSNGCLLTISQSGFPDTAEGYEFLKGCELGWKQTLNQLKQFLETTSER